MKDETEKEEGEIKPAQLWAFLKDNDDIQLVGRVCVALGGHDVELNAAERACLNLIIRDSVWRKRNVDMKRKRNAEYYEKMKGLKKIQSDSETENDLKKIQSDSAPIHPSVRPSIQKDTHSPACAREGDFPTLVAVLAWAAQNVNHPDGKTYPTYWVKEWYETMRTATPPWTNVKGESVLPNWKNAMTWAWKRHLKLDKDNGKGRNNGMPIGVKYQQEGYDASKFGI